ncbi:hypothetical protein PM082_016902 [Marasmius tenuissimus]|nr:hypothetical protein PM082_016902 [Marasmius tenuissimus]
MSSAEPVKVGTRPRTKHARPNSAVYIGSDPLQLQQIASTPPSLPDLPEPPSPVSSSGSGSGLPSPPATNSTGSGSTGDPASIAFRGGTKGNMPLLDEPYVKAFHSAFEQQQQQQQDHSQRQQRYDAVDDDDDDIDNHNNSNEPYAHDDDTAKFNSRPQGSGNTTNDNARALERVKSLQERNRMALTKLSSYSRLSTPSPKPSAQRTKDATARAESSSSSASHSTHSSSSSSSRPSIARNRHSYQPDTAPHPSAIRRDLSGSETERESARGNSSFNSYDDEDEDGEDGSPVSILLNHTSSTLSRSASAKTPGRPTTPSFRETTYSTHLSPRRSIRTRLTSAPASPAKALSSISRSTSGSGGGQGDPLASPGRPRKRSSMGLPSITFDLREREREDLASAALAAVASSRRGLGGTAAGGSVSAGKKRQPLPREFWEGSSNTGSNSINGSAHGDRVGGGSRSRRGSLASSNGHLNDEDDRRRSYSRSPSPSPLESSAGSRSSTRQQRDTNTRNPATLTPGGRRKFYSINTRRTSGAWASEDLGNRSREYDDDDDHEESGYSPAVLGRRQAARAGGSADSVLTIAAGAVGGGRSLLGEGLKAAGLSPVKNRDRGGRDTYATGSMRRRDELVESPVFERDREREERLERIRSQSRAESRPVSRAGQGQGHGRAATSIGMTEYSSRREREEAELDDDVDDERALPPGSTNLRAYKSAYNLGGGRERDRDRERDDRERDRDRDRAPSSLSRYDDRDRVPQSTAPPSVISPLGTRRFNTVSLSDIGRADIPDSQSAMSSRRGGASIDRSDHNSLLDSSLDLFENALSKIPSSSSSSSASNTSDLVRNARVIVGAVEKLNGLLKAGHGRALNAQIDCEVQAAGGGGGGGAGSAEEVWRLVGGEYREGLRVSDDLVRAVTDFLLGVGRAVKDMGIVPSTVEPTGALNGDHHARSVSLDEAGVSRLGRTSMSPDAGSGGARSTGTGSVASGGAHSRRSWEPTPGRDTETLRRLAESRPETSLGVLSTNRTDHRTSITRTTKRAGTPNEPPHSAASTRRLFTPREIREQQLIQDEGGPGGMATFDSQETLHAAGYEPSPTPASRTAARLQQQQSVTNERSPRPLPDSSRTLPPLAIPSPRPALPSEYRQTQTPANKTSASNASTLSRRRTTHGPSSTVRSPAFPLATRDTPTTAVTTTHASGAHEKRAFPLVRGNSNISATSGGSGNGARSTVTFSKSSTTTALSGLQQQQQRAQQQRQRTLSNSSDLRDDSYEYHNELADPPPSSNGASFTSKGRSAITPGKIQRMTSGGSETERDVYRRNGTVRDKDGSRAPRISFDESSLTVGVKGGNAAVSGGHAADRAAMSTIGQKRERRRTVVDMWPRGGS